MLDEDEFQFHSRCVLRRQEQELREIAGWMADFSLEKPEEILKWIGRVREQLDGIESALKEKVL
jgi:hypothetical protein